MSLLNEITELVINAEGKDNPQLYAKAIVSQIRKYLQIHHDQDKSGKSWFCRGDMRLTTIECLKEILIDDHTRGIAQSEPKSKA